MWFLGDAGNLFKMFPSLSKIMYYDSHNKL